SSSVRGPRFRRERGVLGCRPTSRSSLVGPMRATFSRRGSSNRRAYTVARATRHTAHTSATEYRRPVVGLRSPATSSTSPAPPLPQLGLGLLFPHHRHGPSLPGPPRDSPNACPRKSGAL